MAMAEEKAAGNFLNLCFGFLALALVVYVVRHFLDYGWNRGTFQYPYFGCLFEMLKNEHRFLDWTSDNLKKVPSKTVRLLLPGEAVFAHTADPENIEHILKTKFENYVKGEYFQEGLTDLLGGGIFNVDDGLWKLQRKAASFEFTTRSLRDYLIAALETETRVRLIPTVESFCSSSKVLDLQDMFMRFSFDSICTLAFGVDPAALGPSFPEIKFMKVFDDATTLSNARFYVVHPLVWKFKKLFNIGSEKRLREAIKDVYEFADSVIQTRRQFLAHNEDAARQSDLLSRFMSMEDVPVEELEEIDKFYHSKSMKYDRCSSVGRYPDILLRDIIISFILAGKDTTSASLSWFFWLISTHPHVEEKIIVEMDSIREARVKSSDGTDLKECSSFSYDELKEMHYLHAAIFENLRLYPSVPMDPKEARQDDILPDGTRVRKKSRATCNIYAMGRMESLWGKDCLEFRPERWLKDGRFNNESAYKFPVFLAGPRMCLGKDMAVLQMKYVVAALLPTYSFKPASEDYQPKYKLSLTLQMEGGFPVLARNKRMLKQAE